MEQRYLLLVGGAVEHWRPGLDRLVRAGRFRVALESEGLLLLANAATPAIVLGNRRGIVVGALFDADRGGAVRSLSPTTAEIIIGTRLRYLVDRFWGGYIAVLRDAETDRPSVLRAPFGWLPCLHVSVDGVEAFASDVDLLVETGLYVARLDVAALARHLAAGDVRRSDTCLASLAELRGGCRWSLEEPEEALWTPWRFAASHGPAEDDHAESNLRDVANRCVADRTEGHASTMLLLSGGLDSSIVAASLASSERPFTAFTYLTDDPSGDERHFAQAVANHTNAAMIESRCAVDDVDLTRSAGSGRPRPVARGFEQSIDAALRCAKYQRLATLAVDGGGGDNIFCSLQSPVGAADCLLDPAGRSYFWRTVRNIAAMTGASVATVAWRAAKRAMSRRPYRRVPDTSFLSPAACALATGALDHPWLNAPAGTLPGKTAHVALLIGAQGVVEDSDPLAEFPHHSILIAQPLIEVCLRVPTWRWFERGCNRAAARRAFQRDLPSEIAWRRGKGSPDSFLVQLLEHNRAMIRQLLTQGVLAHHGLLDVASVAAQLDDQTPARGPEFARIMQLVDAEIWARSWPP